MLGVVVVTVAVTIPQQRAEAAGCENGFPNSASRDLMQVKDDASVTRRRRVDSPTEMTRAVKAEKMECDRLKKCWTQW